MPDIPLLAREDAAPKPDPAALLNLAARHMDDDEPEVREPHAVDHVAPNGRVAKVEVHPTHR